MRNFKSPKRRTTATMPRICPVGSDLAHAAELLRGGRLVAFGTETVYGLGAHARDTSAVARVFAVKNRPTFDPLIVHIAAAVQVHEVAAEFPSLARVLAERFWPGPLTLVLPKHPGIPDLVTAGRSTVAVRVPGSEPARDLLRAAGVPVAAPSANPFGRISPTTADHVAEGLGSSIDYIFDTGPCRVGIESTVVDVTDAVPQLLRPGGIARELLEEVVGPLGDPPASTAGCQVAPGNLSQHYAPGTPLRIVERPVTRLPRTGLLTLCPNPDAASFERVEVLSDEGDLIEAAANFFAALRRLDAAGLDEIQACLFPERDLGRALNDRLRRAAATFP